MSDGCWSNLYAKVMLSVDALSKDVIYRYSISKEFGDWEAVEELLLEKSVCVSVCL